MNAPRKYSEIPPLIEAIQWIGTNLEAIKEFTKSAPNSGITHRGEIIIPQGCCNLMASKGDFITKNQMGNFTVYPVKMFREMYQPFIEIHETEPTL